MTASSQIATENAASSAASSRRTFAIISHPDAGKTTLTEKLLLSGGAIRQAGEVKARGDRRRARSDWMKIEQQRGISVTSSVMTFERDGVVYNLLDTPGHQDFSEDTYRTLTAVDSAIMVLDAAKGIEPQTRKLFEVCRIRNIPIITFINKVDREGKDPFALLDEVGETLALDVTPMNWPAGMGNRFAGLYNLADNRFTPTDGAAVQMNGLDDPAIDGMMEAETATLLRDEAGLALAACPAFDLQAYLSGDLTPVFFGSALREYGMDALLDGLAAFAPPPRTQPALPSPISPEDPVVSGFIFKVQANMDPNHRDRVAFMRLCSGTLKRGMKLNNSRLGKPMGIHNPIFFFAQDRELADEALPGDIIGIPNHGTLRVGDTLVERGATRFTGLPDFAPEILRRVRLDDPMKTKQMRKALGDLAEEGIARVFRPSIGSNWIVGVVGALQLDVLASRIAQEYDVAIGFEESPYDVARWIGSDDPAELKRFMEAERLHIAEDGDDDPVFMSRSLWVLERAVKEWPGIRFTATKERS